MPVWLLLLSVAIAPLHTVSTAPPHHADWTDHRLIAHGMGGIDGKATTNCYEAFIVGYEKGFRVFETDFRLSADGRLVALHDWTAFLYGARGAGKPDPADRKPVDWATFKSLKVDRKYRSLDIFDIVSLLVSYPDAYVVTDTKDRGEKLVRRQFALIAAAADASVVPGARERIVPQVYNPAMYAAIESQYAFASYIYTLYGSHVTDAEVVRFVSKTPKIKAVTMPESRVSAKLASALAELGVKTYTHTVNDPDVYEAYRKLGVDGVYTDFLDPRKFDSR